MFDYENTDKMTAFSTLNSSNKPSSMTGTNFDPTQDHNEVSSSTFAGLKKIREKVG